MWRECSISFCLKKCLQGKESQSDNCVKSISTEEGVQANIESEERCPISAAVTILYFQKQMPFTFSFFFPKKDKNKKKC